MYHAPHGGTANIVQSLESQMKTNGMHRYVMAEANSRGKKHIYGLIRLNEAISLPYGMRMMRLEGLSSVVSPTTDVIGMLKYLVHLGVKMSNFDLSGFEERQARKEDRYVDLSNSTALVPVNTPKRHKRKASDIPSAPMKRARSSDTNSDTSNTWME